MQYNGMPKTKINRTDCHYIPPASPLLTLSLLLLNATSTQIILVFK